MNHILFSELKISIFTWCLWQRSFCAIYTKYHTTPHSHLHTHSHTMYSVFTPYVHVLLTEMDLSEIYTNVQLKITIVLSWCTYIHAINSRTLEGLKIKSTFNSKNSCILLHYSSIKTFGFCLHFTFWHNMFVYMSISPVTFFAIQVDVFSLFQLKPSI